MDLPYECPHACGRRFQNQEKVDEHVKRKHIISQAKLPSLYENLKSQKKKIQPILNKIPEHQIQKQLSQQIQPPQILVHKKLNVKSILRPKSGKFNLNLKQEQKQEQEEKIVKILEPPIQVSTAELLESKKLITRSLIYKNSDASSIEDVTHLSLNEKNLIVFESTLEVQFENFTSLKSLSLSHNKLINAIGVSQLSNIIELNINHNFITSLQPLANCRLLQKLFASYNRIQEIDLNLMIHLKVFHIGNNQLHDFEQLTYAIQQMPSLMDLEVQNNPCTQAYAYKYDILWTVFIEKLDNETITEQDYNLAQAFREGKRETNIQQQQQLMSQSMYRPTTAPITQEDYGDYELEAEVEELQIKNEELMEKVEKLERQNLELREEANKVPYLEDQVRELRKQVSCYETLTIFKDSPESELKEYIYRLTMELETLKMGGEIQTQELNPIKKMENQSKFQTTQTTNLQQMEECQSDQDQNEDDDDDDKYFKDDDNYVDQPSNEIMELIMRNSMSLSKLKDDFQNI